MSRPQTNGQVESANKIILAGIKKKIEGAKGTWDEELPGILWAMRTTMKDATRHTPFFLVYGSEVILTVVMITPCKGPIDSGKNLCFFIIYLLISFEPMFFICLTVLLDLKY